MGFYFTPLLKGNFTSKPFDHFSHLTHHWPKNLNSDFRGQMSIVEFAREKQNSNFVKFLGQFWVK